MKERKKTFTIPLHLHYTLAKNELKGSREYPLTGLQTLSAFGIERGLWLMD